MSVLVDDDTRLLVQGITGREGSLHAQLCRGYGTQVVAGCTPGRGGSDVDGIPVFDTVVQAAAETGANASLILVPAPFATDAIFEAAATELPLVVCITEGIPTLDMVRVRRALAGGPTVLIGPNCPGVISPGKAKVGIMPADVFSPGSVGVISRSGTLLYEVVSQLTRRGIGQSTCIGCGGDPIVGTTFVEALQLLARDPQTEAIVIIGEIGGSAEQEAAEFVRSEVVKPVVAFVAGSTAPPGRRMGHAGAIVSGSSGRAEEKIKALRAAGVRVAESPAQVGALTQEALQVRA